MEIKPAVASGGDFTEKHEGMFGGDWNILDLNCGDYLTVYVCQNTDPRTKMVNFPECKLQLRKAMSEYSR